LENGPWNKSETRVLERYPAVPSGNACNRTGFGKQRRVRQSFTKNAYGDNGNSTFCRAISISEGQIRAADECDSHSFPDDEWDNWGATIGAVIGAITGASVRGLLGSVLGGALGWKAGSAINRNFTSRQFAKCTTRD
ncbi:unnamed protein product, partial [Amoebophrya sp. A25]